MMAGAALVWLMVAIVWSVTMRNLGMQPHAWLFTSTEYGVFYMTMLGAPWLVRKRGHVHIELVTAAARCGAAGCQPSGGTGCVVVCGGWRGAVSCWSRPTSRATILTCGPISIPALASDHRLSHQLWPDGGEFARFVVGREMMHSGKAGIHE
jgi:C4-dicarboxylate transporter, DctQ subunit